MVARDARKKEHGSPMTFIQAYIALHKLGFAHSVEAWNAAGELGRGLYGVSLGSMFFGESMFAQASNASKAAFITLADHLCGLEFRLDRLPNHESPLGLLGCPPHLKTDFLEELQSAMENPPDEAHGTSRRPYEPFFKSSQDKGRTHQTLGLEGALEMDTGRSPSIHRLEM